jgi:DNA helicase HerA-like ATPase
VKIHLSRDVALPLEVVTESIGILARKRAGKSYTAKRFAEQLSKASVPIAVLDPVDVELIHA